MTDEEKELIKKEIFKAYIVLKMFPSSSTRYTMAIKIGLNNAQRILNEKKGVID